VQAQFTRARDESVRGRRAHRLSLAWLCGAAILLAGCGSSEPPPQKTVFDPMTSKVDEVKQKTDAIVDQRKGNLDQAIEADTN
jgi:hypothetical protein